MKNLTIKELPSSERPYEKLLKYGETSLSDAELLAIIIKTGTREETSVCIAQRILKLVSNSKGIGALNDLSIQELTKVKGIGNVKALQIKAVLELAKRISKCDNSYGPKIKSPQDVANLVMDDLKYKKQEFLQIAILDTKNQVLKISTIAQGGLNKSIIEPREIFCEPLKLIACSIILIHNHPSGDPTPSEQDISFTKKIYNAGKLLGIDVLDHIVVGNQKFISLKESSLF